MTYSAKARRSKPEEFFYVSAIPASTLRRLSGIYRRSVEEPTPRAQDLGIQRKLEDARTREIGRYVTWGYPLSGVPESQRTSKEFRTLRKPGWLATSVVVNVLKPQERRGDGRLDASDAVRVEQTATGARFHVPARSYAQDWSPAVRPIEIIDGQHRLFSFDEEASADFELPVVLFHGLDVSWQAYLFWVINIKPKRITPSLAYDLYPLLRTEDWLEKFAGHQVYRESRAQELTEALWAHPESPWRGRINMLGESGFGPAPTQAAWVRALLGTFVKSWEGRKSGVGGLFGAPYGSHETVLPWDRGQQAAFLIEAWRQFHDAVVNSDAAWVTALSAELEQPAENHPAFFGAHSIIPSDQGIRGVLSAFNDLAWFRAEALQLHKWKMSSSDSPTDEERITEALTSIRRHRAIHSFISEVASGLSRYDWRSITFPDLPDELVLEKQGLRGSGGYRVLKEQLLTAVGRSKTDAGAAARTLLRS